MRLVLDASGRDASVENSAGFIDSPEPHELLAGHEERRHIGRVVARQLGESSQGGGVTSFLVELHREAVTKKGVARIVGKYGFDLFAARHNGFGLVKRN